MIESFLFGSFNSVGTGVVHILRKVLHVRREGREVVAVCNKNESLSVRHSFVLIDDLTSTLLQLTEPSGDRSLHLTISFLYVLYEQPLFIVHL